MRPGFQSSKVRKELHSAKYIIRRLLHHYLPGGARYQTAVTISAVGSAQT